MRLNKLSAIKNKILRPANKQLLIFSSVLIFIFLLAPKAYALDFGIASFGAGAATTLMAEFLILVRAAINALIRVLAEGTTSVLGIQIDNVAVVQTSWSLVRNFANMFFIIALIIMAFGTIFSVSKYDFRTMIVRFLIAALLINFSLVIGEIIIEWSQSLSNVFLKAIGSIGDKIGQASNFSARLGEAPPIPGSPPDSVFFQNTLKTILDIILLSVVLFSTAILFVFSLVRIPILWVLLIVSPVAWITYILPTTQDINRRWWKYFIGWNVFMPMYLFFIYFGILFLQNGKTITDSIAGSGTGALGIAFQDIFLYVLIAIFLIGGAKAAMSSSMAAGAGGVAGAIWAKGRATARYTRSGIINATGVPGAYKEAKTYYGREGVRIPGTDTRMFGTRQREEQDAKIAGMFGVPGVAEKQTQRRIQAAEQKFKDSKKYDENELIRTLGSGTFEEKVAASSRLKDLGRNLTGSEIAPIFQEYSKISPSEAVRWIRGQNIDNLDRAGLDALESANDIQLNQKIGRIRAKRNLIPDASSYQKILSRFNNNEGEMVNMIGDSKEFIDGLKGKAVEDILDAIPPSFSEAKKKFAMQVVEKGFLGDRLRELAGTNKDPNDNGVFGSASEADRFLDLAKTANLYEALALKAERGTLKDAYAKDSAGQAVTLLGPEGIAIAMKQEFDKMDTEKLSKIRSDDTKKTGFANPEVLQAFENSLSANRRGGDKVKGMYLDPKFYNNSPLVGYLEGALQRVRINTLKKERGEPFENKVQEIIGILIPQIKSAKDSGNQSNYQIALKKAEGAMKQARDIAKAINETDFASTEIRDKTANILADAEVKLQEAKNYSPKKS